MTFQLATELRNLPRRRLDAPKPFLKWAGGKRSVLPAIRAFYPAHCKNYIEPFLGAGTVFFDFAGHVMDGAGPVPKNYLLSDANPDLIGCYDALRRDPDAVAAELIALRHRHRKNARACFLELRDSIFNPRRAELAGGNPVGRYSFQMAALFIYLNKAGYNGLYRLNRQGKYNVPPGRQNETTIFETGALMQAADFLGRPFVKLKLAQYEDALGAARPGDFVYLDPPYAAEDDKPMFNGYTALQFTKVDQRRLAHIVLELAAANVQVLLSNSHSGDVERLYVNASARKVGLHPYTVRARRSIGRNSKTRGQVFEYLISNIPPFQVRD